MDAKFFWGSTLYHVDDLPFKLEEMPSTYGGFKTVVHGVTVRNRCLITACQDVRFLWGTMHTLGYLISYILISLSPYLLISLSPYLLISLSPYLLISLSPISLISLSPISLISYVHILHLLHPSLIIRDVLKKLEKDFERLLV